MTEGKKTFLYQLAKELKVDAKELISLLREMGKSNPSPMTELDPTEVKKIKKAFDEKKSKTSKKVEVIEVQVAEGIKRRRKIVAEEEAPAPTAKVQETKPAEPEKKKKVVKKKTVSAKKIKEKTPSHQPIAEEAPPPPVLPAEPPPPPEPIPQAQASEPKAVEKKPVGIEILKSVEKPVIKKPKVKLRWVKPLVRKTARATDEIPGPEVMTQEPKQVEVEPEVRVEKEKKKDKKKKGIKAKAELEDFLERPVKGKKVKEPTKRKLPRKIAFKLERGAFEEGLDWIETDRIYIPQKKKIISKKRPAQKPQITVPSARKRVIRMGEKISCEEVARRMGVKLHLVQEKLNQLGLGSEPDALLDYDTTVLVAHEFGYEVVQEVFDEAKIIKFPTPSVEAGKASRPPVVTVMGHVDHGKTTLLDYIRKTKIAEKEPGLITQSIGASLVEGPAGKIVFIDTPGHSAFTKMRARGAEITDIVVLVVAADDGVMPQTIEAINHAKAAKAPIVVALNKIDLPDAKPDQVKSKLAELGLMPEEWGGDTLMVPCSARTGQGVDELLEAISLQAEMLQLQGNPNLPARGFVLESKLEKGRGPVVSVIIKDGTLKPKDYIVCGIYAGRVRALFDHLGRNIPSAGPSMPVEVIGLDGVPEAGEELIVVEDDKAAKLIAEHRAEKKRSQGLSGPVEATMEDLLKKMAQEQKPELNIIVKAETHGAVEAVLDSIAQMKTGDVEIKIIHSGPGAITENDVLLAETTKAVIIGFGVRPESKAGKLAEEKGVQIYMHRIIYELLDELTRLMKGKLKVEKKERILGRAEVRQVFNISKVGTVAGCFVQDGVVQRGAQVRVLRDNAVVYEGRIGSLKRFKDDVREVQKGLECGIGIENFNDIKPGDIFEFYLIEEKPNT